MNETDLETTPLDLDPLLDGLTEPQREAVTHVDGPLLVLAGPGSGKTRVITRRIAHLVHRVGIAPWNVLAITFTNKAAGEMRERVGQLLTERQTRAVTIATFHALCARLLRTYAEKLELPPGYSIYDTADQKRAVKEALADLEISTKNFPPTSMLAAISNAKNELIDAEAFAADAQDFYKKTVAKVYTRYTRILKRNHALDFDDLLMRTVDLLQVFPEVADELRERFQYILVDEYQDTNGAQFRIAQLLATAHKNLCVTGDPDQSIYGWRGANIQNILDFESHFPNATTVRLEQNYRSTAAILRVADALIQNNRARKHKQLWTDNNDGEPVTVARCRDEQHEASWVIERFRELHDEGLPWGQMAIFYRMNSLSRVLEEALREAGIPYQIARGTAFYDRAEIKNALGYLQALVNPADEVALLRIINTPTRGISDKTVKLTQQAAARNDLPFIDLIQQPANIPGLGSRAVTSVENFIKLIRRWRAWIDPDTHDAPDQPTCLRDLVDQITRESGLHAHYADDKSDPDRERLANLAELVSFAQQFEDQFLRETVEELEQPTPHLSERLLALLERVALVADVDGVASDQGAVTMMTLHAAKGLEYPAVAIVGTEDGLLPHERSQNTDRELEEERRLAFVGITRAMKRLFLTHARYRTAYGQALATIPSRFLNELPPEDIIAVEPEAAAVDDFLTATSATRQRRAAARHEHEFPEGTLVRHPRFGLGRVLEIAATGAHTKARVAFNTAGTRTLILQYARLEKVED
ncbi:ATP-dependent helicase [Mucisphaera calidilacus]|uniref:DNA 3'-5' helicase n=1 Tax=Mucisphaera calidilacus TaxID=2527982 RepID=A0A518BY88_9BACT|nr:UvrD-helicase domain-containing protein [Mucisphaera calidilacus]QDU71943.1 ATP-dependent DNA helicase PcrA [Mucisphaera calidilacus]